MVSVQNAAHGSKTHANWVSAGNKSLKSMFGDSVLGSLRSPLARCQLFDSKPTTGRKVPSLLSPCHSAANGKQAPLHLTCWAAGRGPWAVGRGPWAASRGPRAVGKSFREPCTAFCTDTTSHTATSHTGHIQAAPTVDLGPAKPAPQSMWISLFVMVGAAWICAGLG